MATLLGSLLVSLGLESAQFDRGASAAEKRLSAMQRRVVGFGKSMQGLGSQLTVGLTAPLVSLGAVAVKGFIEQEKAVAGVSAALRSMGDASGKTQAELVKTADALELRSLFDAEVILSQVTANLLTFGNVAGEQFDRAQQAALDMATRLGGEPQAAAIQLGKALNDPVKGISALTRVGVQFTAQQKLQIKAMTEAGNVAGAQGIILAEVEKQFSGAAAAAANADPFRRLSVEFGQMADAIGGALLPVIGPLADAIGSMAGAFADLPKGAQSTIVVIGAVAAAAGPLLLALGGIVTLAPAIAAGFALVSGAALPVAAVVAGVAAAGYLIYQNWDQISPVLDAVADSFNMAIGGDLRALIDSATAKLTELWNGPLGTAVRVVGETLLEFQLAYARVLGEGVYRASVGIGIARTNQ